MPTYDTLEEAEDDIARIVANEWRQNAIKQLRMVGDKLDYEVEPVINSFTDVEKESGEYVWEVTHPAASIFEYGTTEHTITPDQADVLAFEDDGGNTVFAKEVEVSGVNAILYVTKSKNTLSIDGERIA